MIIFKCVYDLNEIAFKIMVKEFSFLYLRNLLKLGEIYETLRNKEIRKNRLILRRYVSEDALAIYKNWASDSEVTKYLMWQPHSNIEVSKSINADWLKQYSDEKYYNWAIVLKDGDDEPIGNIAVGSNE